MKRAMAVLCLGLCLLAGAPQGWAADGLQAAPQARIMPLIGQVPVMAQEMAAMEDAAEAAALTGAGGAALIEQGTGRVLYQSGGENVLPMASTTKIMTALCVLENARLDEVVEIDASCIGVEGSSIYLEAGEHLTVEDLLYGLMLRSGNDAAEALARHVGGSVQGFVEMMNRKAVEMGLDHTAFANPHGLPAEGHYTTALELAAITRQAFDWEPFRTIVATQRKVIPWEGHEYDRAMANKNKMLTQYAGGNGVKTGYTKAAGRCLVSSARRDGMQLIAVVLNCPDMWEDSARLLDYGFDNFTLEPVLDTLEPICRLPCAFSDEIVPVLPQSDYTVPLREGEKVSVALKIDKIITNPVARGDILGYATISVGNQCLAEIPLLSARSVSLPVQTLLDTLRKIWDGWYLARG